MKKANPSPLAQTCASTKTMVLCGNTPNHTHPPPTLHTSTHTQGRATPLSSECEPLDSGIWRTGDPHGEHGVVVQPIHSKSINSGSDDGTPLWLQSDPASQSVNAAGGGLKGLRALRDSKNRS
jgi:hypothetical protein